MATKEKRIELYYAGQRLNGDNMLYAYSKIIPDVKIGEYFSNLPDEKLMLFKKRMLGYEAIGKCIQATLVENGTKGPYSLVPNKVAPKEVVEFWSTIEATDKGRHLTRKESKVKLDGDVEKLIKIIKAYSPSRKHAAIYALLKLL